MSSSILKSIQNPTRSQSRISSIICNIFVSIWNAYMHRYTFLTATPRTGDNQLNQNTWHVVCAQHPINNTDTVGGKKKEDVIFFENSHQQEADLTLHQNHDIKWISTLRTCQCDLWCTTAQTQLSGRFQTPAQFSASVTPSHSQAKYCDRAINKEQGARLRQNKSFTSIQDVWLCWFSISAPGLVAPLASRVSLRWQ